MDLGGGSSTQTVRKRDPESAELKSLQAGIYNMLAPIIGVDSGTASNAYNSTISDAVNSGVLPNANTRLQVDDRGRYYYDSPQTITGWTADENGSGDPIYSGGRQYVNADNVADIYAAQQGLSAANQAQDVLSGWGASNFGQDWTSLRNRVNAAGDAYDQALSLAPGLQGNVLNAAGRIDALANTAQSALQPNINNMNAASAAINGLAGQTAALGDAEARALQPNIDAITKQAGLLSSLAESGQTALQPNINNMNSVSGKLNDLGDRINTGAANYASASDNINRKIEGVGDRQGRLATTVQNFTETGAIPEEMKRNLMATVNGELNRNTGSALNDLAARGVMNSSVANRSIDNLANSAADAYAKNYLDAYNAVLGGYGNTNSVLDSQVSSYDKARAGLDYGWQNQLAGYDAARNAWNSSLNGYEGANNQITQGFNNRMGAINNAVNAYNTANANIRNSYADRHNALNSASGQYQNAISGWNTANNNISTGYNNRLNGMNTALGGYQQAYSNNANQMQNMASMPQSLAKSAFAQYEPVYNFWQGLRNSYDSKEDTDTIVKQGK